MSLYAELKRRNVFRVAIAYLAAAWLITEVSETIFPLFGHGDTPARIVVTVPPEDGVHLIDQLQCETQISFFS